MNLHICEAILDCRAGSLEHGGFVTFMAKRDYAHAAFSADADNSAHFCELVKFSEWSHSYGPAWAQSTQGCGRTSAAPPPSRRASDA